MIPGEALLARVLGGIALVGAVWAGYSWWEAKVERRGYNRATADWVEKERQISAAAEAKYTKQLEDAQALTAQLQLDITARENVRIAREKEHEKNVADAVARTRAGAERLSIRTSGPACAPAGEAAAGAAGAAGAPGAEERADVVPEVAAELVSIGAASARDVRDFNDLLDEYNALRSACTK